MTVDELMALAEALFDAGQHETATAEGTTGGTCARAEEKSIAARATLRAALEAVVADARRLDWMSRGGIINVDSIGGVDPLDDSRVELYWIRTFSDTGTVDADNLRAAIDAASTTQKGGAA